MPTFTLESDTQTGTLVEPLKPGYKATETWLNFATGVLGAAIAAHLIGDGGAIATIGGLALSLAATVIHTYSRTKLKAAGAGGK